MLTTIEDLGDQWSLLVVGLIRDVQLVGETPKLAMPICCRLAGSQGGSVGICARASNQAKAEDRHDYDRADR
jgi:hypothetical protein